MTRTLYDKIWQAHTIREGDDGLTLLHVGRHFIHDGSMHAFDFLGRRGLKVRRPDQVFAIIAGGVYLVAVMLLMRKSKEHAVAIAAFHFALWLLFSGGVWLSAWVSAEGAKLPPG